MHNKSQWDNLDQKTRERLMREVMGTSLGTPQGWQIDKMLTKHQVSQQNPNYNSHGNQAQSNQSYGPGDIPA